MQYHVPTGGAKAFHGGASFRAIGEDFSALSRRHNVIDADVLDAWYPPSPKVVEALQSELEWLVKTSPPTHADGVKETISQVRGVALNKILVGSGSSSLMFSALPRLISPTSKVAILDPMYGEYKHILQNVIGCEVISIALNPESGFKPASDVVINAAVGCQMVILVNPNSPTGVALGAAEIREIANGVSPETLIWIDETYVDFTPGNSAEQFLQELPNIIVCKSLSKFYALSGMRAAYLAGNETVLNYLERFIPPWSLGLMTQVAVVNALTDPNYYELRRQQTVDYREEFSRALSKISGILPVEGVANFIMFAVEGNRAAKLCKLLQDENIFLRDCTSLSNRFDGQYVRTAVKTPECNERIIQAIAECVKKPL